MVRSVRVCALAALAVTTSCSSGATSATPTVQTADVAQQAVVQFAVGTATIAYAGGTFIGTNMVATLRAADGHSAVLSNMPTITGPPAFAIGFTGTPNSLTGVLPNVLSQAIVATENGAPYPKSLSAGLGPYVGVFGYGMAADNLLSSQVSTKLNALKSAGDIPCNDLYGATINQYPYTETPPSILTNGVSNPPTSEAQSNELSLPIGVEPNPNSPSLNCPLSPISGAIPVSFALGGSPTLPIDYYGGPPAWPSAQGYGTPTFFIGYPLGFTDFAAAPVVGTYKLDVAYATNVTSTSYGHFDATATLRTANPLPPLAIGNATINADGSGSVSLNVPPGLFETIVFVRTADCSGQTINDDNYAIVTHSAGPQSFFFGAHLGPPNAAGQPASTFCTIPDGGYQAIAFAAGFDYPAYESSYPFNLSQTPAITNGDGHTGQADVTTSLPLSFAPPQ